MDVMALLPHSKKDVKVQAKDNKSSTLNELTDLKGCSSCLLFEVCYFHFSDSSLSAIHATASVAISGLREEDNEAIGQNNQNPNWLMCELGIIY